MSKSCFQSLDCFAYLVQASFLVTQPPERVPAVLPDQGAGGGEGGAVLPPGQGGQGGEGGPQEQETG